METATGSDEHGGRGLMVNGVCVFLKRLLPSWCHKNASSVREEETDCDWLKQTLRQAHASCPQLKPLLRLLMVTQHRSTFTCTVLHYFYSSKIIDYRP